MNRVISLVVLLGHFVSPVLLAQTNTGVGPVPVEVREKWELDVFYQKYIAAGPLPIVSSSNTSDKALLETSYLVDKMLSGRPDILNALAERRAKVAVMAHNEYTTDLPEQRDMEPKAYWDSRARGMGGADVQLRGGKPAVLSRRSVFDREHLHPRVRSCDPRRSDASTGFDFQWSVARGLHECDGVWAVEGNLRGNESRRVLGRGGAGLVR